MIVAETFETREIAETAFAQPELLEEIANAGVDMTSVEVHYLEELASATKP